MLSSLHVKNIALIESLDMEFAQGLNILSGETGAGKSILIGSIGLALGFRADKELIRTGQDKAEVTAIIEDVDPVTRQKLEQYGIELEEDTLILSRQLQVNGKSVCRINGIIVPLNVLRLIAEDMITLHGQNEHQKLFQEETHIDFIDNYEKEKINPRKEAVADLYEEYACLKKQCSENQLNDAEKERLMDMLQFQIHEIDSAELKEGEEEALIEEKERLINAEKIATAMNSGYDALHGGYDASSASSALDLIQHSIHCISQVSELSSEYGQIVDRMSDAYYTLEDVAEEIKNLGETINYDEPRLNQIEERLSLLQNLKRKYGKTVEEIERFCESAKEQYQQLESSEKNYEDLIHRFDVIKKKLYNECELLHQSRVEVCTKFEIEVNKQLKDLGMGNAVFRVEIADLPAVEEVTFTKKGVDRIRFLISTNLGEPLKPLKKIISGGEASRIMLALKNILAQTDNVGTLIFDEIDTGISGSIAGKVALKLNGIAKYRQVICITHLAQLASFADRHFLIEKRQKDGHTITDIIKLDEKQQIYEVARLSSGSNSKIAIQNAKELIAKANEIKK